MKCITLILISFLLLPGTEILAQVGEQIVFKAVKVNVHLNDGTRLIGRMVGVAGDSLLLIKDQKAAVGCHISLTYKNPTLKVEGDVIAVDDSVLVLAVSEPPYRQNLLMSNITNLELKYCPLNMDIQEFHGTFIGLSKIGSVWVKGNVFPGLIMGFFIVLPVLGSAAISINSPFLSPFLAVVAVSSPIIGAVMTAGKSFNIQGDHRKFDRLAKKYKRKYQPMPARPGW